MSVLFERYDFSNPHKAHETRIHMLIFADR